MIMRINLPSLLVLAAAFLFATSTSAQVQTNPWGAREQSGYGRPTPLPRFGEEKQVPIFPALDNPFGGAVIELALEITEFQREQAVPIVEAARAAAEPLLVDLAQARQDLEYAVNSAAGVAEIDALATLQGQLLGQLAAIGANARIQIRALLTPDQIDKLDEIRERFESRSRERRGRRRP